MLAFYDFSVAIAATGDWLRVPEELDADALLFATGSGGAWDTSFREIGNVIHDPSDTGKEYKMVYSGHSGTYSEAAVYIGYAYASAPEGPWTKQTTASPLIARALEDPYVVKSGSTYYLYAEDKADTPFRNIRCYTSTDFATWTDQGDILDIGVGWDGVDVSSPVVWIEGSTWHMLYEGRSGTAQQGAIGHATSTDGLVWTRDAANPIYVATNATYGYAGLTWGAAVVPDDILLTDDGRYILFGHANATPLSDTWSPFVAAGRSLYTLEDVLGEGVTVAAYDQGVILPMPDSAEFFHAYAASGTGVYLSPAATPLNAAPSFSVDPVLSTVSGFTGEGDIAVITPGTGTGVAPIYRWQRDGVEISGETGLTYTLAAADLGANITASESIITSGGETTATTASIGPVVTPAFTTLSASLSDASALTLSDGSTIQFYDRTA